MGTFRPDNRGRDGRDRDSRGGRDDRGRDSRPRSGGGRPGGSRFGGGRGGFGRDSGGGRDRGERRPLEMHDVVCDKCGKECQVPFRPSGGKPVLCSDCFRKSDSGGSRDRPTSSGMSSEQFNQINAKLDKILEFLDNLELEDDIDEEEDEETEGKAI